MALFTYDYNGITHNNMFFCALKTKRSNAQLTHPFHNPNPPPVGPGPHIIPWFWSPVVMRT